MTKPNSTSISLLLFLIFPFVLIGQYFSGEIVYEMKIIPKSDTLDLKEIIDSKHGTRASYIITAKKYKSTYYKDGKYKYSYTYSDESKRMYDDYSAKPYVTYRDSRKSNYEYYGSEMFRDSTETVLDYDCYMVKTDAEYGISRTYYSDEIRVDYRDFEGHKVGNWYNKLKEVNGAIALKTITEHDTYFEIQEAVEINKREIENSEFDLPEKPIAASFTALDKRVEMIQPSQEVGNCYMQKMTKAEYSGSEKLTIYLSFLLTTDGAIKFVEPYGEDDIALQKVAIDIMTNCGIQFVPGEIEGQSVDSQVYFPIEFRN